MEVNRDSRPVGENSGRAIENTTAEQRANVNDTVDSANNYLQTKLKFLKAMTIISRR